jgi:hypothetical protein
VRAFLSIILTFFSFLSLSQNISVLSFERKDNDLDARVHAPVKDQNGDIAALLKIETTETNFEFEGGSLGIVKAERKTGEYWVYVPWGLTRITIKHPQLGILRDYVFPEKIDKATVYIMKLSTGKVVTTIEETEILTQWLVVISEPEGASVYIEDKPVGKTPYSGKFSLGKYKYTIDLPMYHKEVGVFELTGEEDKYRIESELKPNFGSLSIITKPEDDAQVILNGRPMNRTTPCEFNKILSGKHSVSIKKDLYYDVTQEVVIEDGKETKLVVDMQAAYAILKITSEPLADIYVDNQKQTTYPIVLRKTSGVYTVEARKENYYTDSKTIQLTDGQELDILLSPKPKIGNLELITHPPDFEVFVDNEYFGTSPITIKNLLIGNHELKIKKNNAIYLVKNVEIELNETTFIEEHLSDEEKVKINTNPSKAEVYLYGEFIGKTPYHSFLPLGEHEIELVYSDLKLKENIKVEAGKKNEWKFDFYITEAKDYEDEKSKQKEIISNVINKDHFSAKNTKDGPYNALLSVIIPGLGDHRVSNGSKSGVLTALSTYGFITLGVACKIASNLEYEKYHLATSQFFMDYHYDNANLWHQAYLVSIISAGAIWIYDILWVYKIGMSNKNKFNKDKYKFGLNYLTEFNITELSFTYTF